MDKLYCLEPRCHPGGDRRGTDHAAQRWHGRLFECNHAGRNRVDRPRGADRRHDLPRRAALPGTRLSPAWRGCGVPYRRDCLWYFRSKQREGQFAFILITIEEDERLAVQARTEYRRNMTLEEVIHLQEENRALRERICWNRR